MAISSLTQPTYEQDSEAEIKDLLVHIDVKVSSGPLFMTILRLDVGADGWGAGGSTKTLRARSESGRGGADGYHDGAMGSRRAGASKTRVWRVGGVVQMDMVL